MKKSVKQNKASRLRSSGPLFLAVCLTVYVVIVLACYGWSGSLTAWRGEDLPDFEKGFFERTQAGEKSQLLITLASQQDCAIIRSLLQAENIPSYTEGEHMNNIYGGLSGTMTTVVAIKLYILCADYDKAVDIIKNYKMDSSGYTIFDKVE